MSPTERPIAVMMVDDDPLDCMLVKNAFAKLDMPINLSICESGAAALELLASHANDDTLPDGFLLDINMPGMSGIDLLQTMKEDKRLRQIPVIMFSSSDRDQDIAACYDKQAAGYIKKPEQHAVLQDLVANLANLWGKHMRFAA